jgi:hypothetical protein
MNPLKIFRVIGCEATSSITHNEINAELMPEVQKYWASKGSFNHSLYDQIMRIRNTEVIRTEKNNEIQVVFSHSDDIIELRQGFVSMDGLKTDLKAPIVISLDDLDKVYETVFNLKQKQL